MTIIIIVITTTAAGSVNGKVKEWIHDNDTPPGWDMIQCQQDGNDQQGNGKERIYQHVATEILEREKRRKVCQRPSSLWKIREGDRRIYVGDRYER